MSVAVDLELKKAFSEMQSKMVDSKQKMRLADLQVSKEISLIWHLIWSLLINIFIAQGYIQF